MTARQPVEPAPGPLEAYCTRFDDLFRQRSQREVSDRRSSELNSYRYRARPLTEAASGALSSADSVDKSCSTSSMASDATGGAGQASVDRPA